MLIYVLFLVGFVFLIKGADYLVEGASSIAKKLRVSPITIGLTVVAFGTSTPELIVNIFAKLSNSSGIAIGNILGSNIANILLILGVSASIHPLVTKQNTVWKEIPLSLLAAVLVGVMANDTLIDGSSFSGLTRIDGIVLVAFFIIFLYYTFGIAKVSGDTPNDDIKQYSYQKSIILTVVGLIGLTLGGKWIIDGAVKIAEIFGVNQSLIGSTIVAVGTSLPELAASAVAAYKKQSDIAIGNVVGSNIFNIFLILGVSAIIGPLPFGKDSEIDVLMMILSSFILFLLMFIGKKHMIERWQGILILLIYFSYTIFLILTK